MRNIVLADNQEITKLGWRFMFSNQLFTGTITEISSKKQLLENLILDGEKIVILDYTLFDFESVNELIIFQQRFTKTSWIIFSDELSDNFLRTLLFNTTNFSVLLKDSSAEELSQAIKEVTSGNRFICNHVSNVLLDSSKSNSIKNSDFKLTITELEILREMALGKTTKDIALRRHVSAHTVMTHRKNIFRKIEVNNVHEATKYAIRAGIVDLAEYYI